MTAEVKGQFTGWTAAIAFDEATRTGTVDVTIPIAGMTVGSVTPQAAGPEFFDMAKFPTATFTGTIAETNGQLTATGPLTIRGTAAPISLPFTLTITGDTAQMSGQGHHRPPHLWHRCQLQGRNHSGLPGADRRDADREKEVICRSPSQEPPNAPATLLQEIVTRSLPDPHPEPSKALANLFQEICSTAPPASQQKAGPPRGSPAHYSQRFKPQNISATESPSASEPAKSACRSRRIG
jgi:hypothetical protein